MTATATPQITPGSTAPATGERWLKTARLFALESWWPPFWPDLEVDWDKALWTMQRLNLNALQANALTKWACYPTDLMAKHPQLGNRDLLREAAEFCDRHGFRWIIYSLFGHAMPLSTQLSKNPGPALFRPLVKRQKEFPDGHFATVPPHFHEYETRFHFGGERYVTQCVFANRPWLMAHLRELADGYDYHAAWVDGGFSAGEDWANQPLWNACCCPVCQQAYLNDFGVPMPLIDDVADPRLLDLRRWVVRRLDGVLAEARDILTRDGQLELVGNVAHGCGSACFHPPIARRYDAGLYEHAPNFIEMVRKMSESRFVTDVRLHYPDCYDPWPRRVTSGWEVVFKSLTALAHGCTPYLAQPGKYYYDDHLDAPAKEVFDLMAEHGDTLLAAEPVRYATLLQMPLYANQLSGYARHQRTARGAVSAMLDTHVPVETPPYHIAQSREALAGSRVFLLPDLQVIGDDALGHVLDLVQDGRGAYLSMGVGTLDDDLKPRPVDALADALDLRPWEPSDAELRRRYTFDGQFSTGSSRTYDVYLQWDEAAAQAVNFPVPPDSIGPSNLGSIMPGPSWQVLAHALPTDGQGPLLPAVAVKRVGNGRLIYSNIDWTRQYQERRAPDLAAWLRDLVIWLGNAPLPMDVEASRHLCTFVSQTDRASLLTLVNISNDVQSLQDEWWEMKKVCEPPLPIGPVTLRLAGTRQVDTLFGLAPDSVTHESDRTVVKYNAFVEHAVLRLRR